MTICEWIDKLVRFGYVVPVNIFFMANNFIQSAAVIVDAYLVSGRQRERII